jgi:hypothetical protein
MNLLSRVRCSHYVVLFVIFTAIASVASWLRVQRLSFEPEIRLVIGEPWESMRRHSSAAIDPAIPGHSWGRIPKSDARLRFTDPQYGFTTPPARFFTISFDDERVSDVRMSPQIEPLPLDDAFKIALDLQEQWRSHGWRPVVEQENPSFADTSEWRAQLQACRPSTAYWQAGDKYQTLLNVACFQDDKHPGEARYLVTLALSKPWVK